MAIGVSEIRQRIAAKLSELDGCRESKEAPEVFPDKETQPHVSKSFSVQLNETALYGPGVLGSRQNKGTALVITGITVKWSYLLRPGPNKAITDYDLALELEGQIIQKVRETNNTDMHLELLSYSRSVSTEGSILTGEIEFRAIHTISLAIGYN